MSDGSAGARECAPAASPRRRVDGSSPGRFLPRRPTAWRLQWKWLRLSTTSGESEQPAAPQWGRRARRTQELQGDDAPGRTGTPEATSVEGRTRPESVGQDDMRSRATARGAGWRSLRFMGRLRVGRRWPSTPDAEITVPRGRRARRAGVERGPPVASLSNTTPAGAWRRGATTAASGTGPGLLSNSLPPEGGSAAHAAHPVPGTHAAAQQMGGVRGARQAVPKRGQAARAASGPFGRPS